LIQLHGAIFLLGCAPLFAKILPLPAHEITGLRAVFGGIALGLLLALRREAVRPRSRRDAWMLLLVGAVMTAHWASYFHSIQVSTVAVALIGFFTFPVITVFLEPLFFRGVRLTAGSIASAAAVFAGSVLLVGFDGTGGAGAAGFAWGLASALLLAVRNLLIQRHLSGYSGMTVMGWQMLVVAVVLVPTVADWTVLADGRTLGTLIVLGVVFTAGAHSLFVMSLMRLRARTVGVVFCLQPLVGVAMAAVLLGEVPGWPVVAGGTLIVAVAMLESARAAGRTGADDATASKS